MKKKRNNEERFYAKINLEFDSEKKGIQKQEISGDEITIASVLGAAIHHLLESGFDKEILEHAIKTGMEIDEKEEKKIKITKIKLSDENAEELEKLLKKLGLEDK